ncbi:MAG: hypothetical protein KBF21_14090 [Thermoanaerobaculia bacterium]|nr:hypothetical protein [Thermoanaerobaculia bacterium]MBP9825350.1 hypothetical protein [Thermoanaerobaculia bacterium]
MSVAIEIGLNAVIVAVTDEEPRLLTVHRSAESGAARASLELALPSGPLDPERDRTLELALSAWVRGQTGVELGYVEQLYTFGNRFRDSRERRGGPRGIAIAYLALVREAPLAWGAGGSGPDGQGGEGGMQPGWMNCYDFLPWEDWRDGRPHVLEREIAPALERWVKAGADRTAMRLRRERADICFGQGGAPWNGERVHDRFELLYEVGLVAEAFRDDAQRAPSQAPAQAPIVPATGDPLAPPVFDPGIRLGRPLALDHRRILASALGRLRGKLRYRPVVFELLPGTFTLLQLQRTVEALAGLRLHKQNFRRLVEQGGLVEGTGRLEAGTGGRPAELFRFRRDVLRERPAPGVGLPGLRSGL